MIFSSWVLSILLKVTLVSLPRMNSGESPSYKMASGNLLSPYRLTTTMILDLMWHPVSSRRWKKESRFTQLSSLAKWFNQCSIIQTGSFWRTIYGLPQILAAWVYVFFFCKLYGHIVYICISPRSRFSFSITIFQNRFLFLKNPYLDTFYLI